MGFLKNRIATPLVEAFGEALMNSSVGKKMYQQIDNQVMKATKQITDAMARESQMAGAAAMTGGLMGGLGSMAGGGLAGLGGAVLAPVASNYLYPKELIPGSGITYSDLPEEMKNDISTMLRRGA